MSKNSVGSYPKLAEALLQIRQFISPVGMTVFVTLNLLNIIQALRIIFFMMIYNHMSERKQDEEFLDIYSYRNFEILVEIIASGLMIFLVCIALIWFLDRIGIPSSLKSPEFRRLERSVRRRMKRLENQEKFLESFEKLQSEREQTVRLLLKTQDISQQLYDAATANNSGRNKRSKPSDIDKTGQDLFGYAEYEKDQTIIAKTRRKLAAFQPKF